MADKEAEIPSGLCKNDADFLNFFHNSTKELRGLIISNIEFYQRGKSSIHACFYATSCILLERTQVLEPLVLDIVPKLHIYDFSEDVQANGYRSFISIVNRCCVHLIQLCRHININKSSLLFRSSHYLKELEGYVDVLGQLMACLGYLQQLMAYSKDGDLFLADDESVGDDLLLEVEMLNTDCFYGRCLGFQFSDSMQKVLQTVVIAMATFSECYEESSQVIQIASSLFNSGKYFADYDLRAKQVVDVTRTADIKFCKAFWSITDSPLLHQLRSFTFPHVEVSEVLSLEPESFELPRVEDCSDEDDTVTITPPCAHTGPASIKVRLISHAVREGMQITRKRFQPKTGSAKPTVLPPSSGLLFHCHGGGFVAQSSQAHENYLRVWARKLQMPILSVDYALAPELPFPRGLEESFYAYAWALKNPEKLGWTGERICFAGDSAGGNIVISTALRAVSYQIRIPDGIMAAYIPSLVQYTPSPARLMSMIDPLLPVGILTRCLAAYAGIADRFSSALATPIFCNPGKFENWEMVESPTEDTEDPIAAAIANHKLACNHTEEKSANQKPDHKNIALKDSDNDCSRMCSKCSHDVKNISDCTVCSRNIPAMETPEVFQSNGKLGSSHSFPGKSIESLPVCKSLEDLSDCEFVVCDKEKLESEIEHYKGDCTVIQDWNECDTKTVIDEHVINSKIDDLEKMEGESDCVMQNNDIQAESNTGDQNRNKSEAKSLKAEMPFSMQDESFPGEQTKEEKIIYSPSIEDVLNELDSNVVIEIQDTRSERKKDISEKQDPSEMYAMCQELLDVKDETVTDNLDDMRNFSCHSLEDLVDGDDIVTEDFIEGYSNGNLENISDLNSNGTKLNSTGIKYGKQKSDSDGSDSGIHDDTDIVSNYHGNQSITTSKFVVQQNQGSNNSDNQNMISSNESGDREEGGLAELRHKETLPSVPQEQKKLRHMSLDLAVMYHPGQKSADSSPQKVSISPISPQLSPGSRSFKPKLYSVQRKIAQSPIQLFRHLPIVKNMYMSPLLAPDEALKGLPPVHLTACHFDPLLDDSIMFAKKLSRLGKSVSLKVFDNLPHGFLSFSDASVEARQASNFCCDKIQEVLETTTKF